VTDATSYDELPYADYCFPSAPTRSASSAVVGALRPQPAPTSPDAGCWSSAAPAGANLLPMALDLPGADFVGVDLSAAQVDEAARRAEALGLRNARFVARSITEVGDELGDFDYVVCHGVYSWVPAPVREAMLAGVPRADAGGRGRVRELVQRAAGVASSPDAA
jgi:hypothetical protein